MSDLFNANKVSEMIQKHKDKIKEHEAVIVKYQEMIADAREKIAQENEILEECEKYIQPINDLEKKLMEAVEKIESKYNVKDPDILDVIDITDEKEKEEAERLVATNQLKDCTEPKKEIPIAMKYFNH